VLIGDPEDIYYNNQMRGIEDMEKWNHNEVYLTWLLGFLYRGEQTLLTSLSKS